MNLRSCAHGLQAHPSWSLKSAGSILKKFPGTYDSYEFSAGKGRTWGLSWLMPRSIRTRAP
jgi:hypothetical protein